MSYILEGLKKLEKKRQRTEGLNVLDEPAHVSVRKRRKPLWPYLLVLGLLLNASVVFWWLMSDRSELTSDPAALSQAIPVSEVAATGKTVLETSPGPPAASEREVAVRKLPSSNPESRVEKPIAETRVSPKAPKPDRTPAPEPPKALPPPPRHIIAFSELPPGVRKALPEIKIYLHVYSPDRSERFVQINEHTLREGESMPGGLKVLQITPTGTVFLFRDYRFRMSSNEVLN